MNGWLVVAGGLGQFNISWDNRFQKFITEKYLSCLRLIGKAGYVHRT